MSSGGNGRGAPAEQRPFRDRVDAAEDLARALRQLQPNRAVVVAIPRGGVPVGAAVARRLRVDLHVLIARKIAVPTQPDTTLGILCGAEVRLVDSDRLAPGVSQSLERLVRDAREEVAAMESRFGWAALPDRIDADTLIVVDDGIVTGATLRSVLARLNGCGRLVVAAPVGSPEVVERLKAHADAVVCPFQPVPFRGVAEAYQRFGPVTDDTVERILDAHRAQRSAPRVESFPQRRAP